MFFCTTKTFFFGLFILCLTDQPNFISEPVEKPVAAEISWGTFIYYVKGRPLLVADGKDQLLLQQSRGMTDRQMSAFNWVLLQLTGFSIHSWKNSLRALTDGKMSDYIIECHKLIVNKAPQEWHVFWVKLISDVIKSHMMKLLCQ